MSNEVQSTVCIRGLIPNTKDQVFKIFLHKEFRDKFWSTFTNIQSKVKPRMLANEKSFTSASVSFEVLAAFSQLNALLRKAKCRNHHLVAKGTVRIAPQTSS
jgi:hypothetical protein